MTDAMDRLDYYILKTLRQLQDESRGEVFCPGLFERFLQCDENKDLDGSLLLKTQTQVGARLRMFVDRGFIKTRAGDERQLTIEPFMVTVVVTTRGEWALRKGPEIFAEEPDGKSGINIGSITAQQSIVGHNATGQMTINVTLEQLLRAAEEAIDHSDADGKEEAKSTLQKFRENLSTGSAACTVTNTLVNHVPAFADFLRGLGLS